MCPFPREPELGSRKAGMKSGLGQGESALLCSLEQGATRQHFLHAQIFLGAPEMLPFFKCAEGSA